MSGAVFFVSLLTLTACAKKSVKPDLTAGEPVPVSKALFHNPDSLAYYAALAYKDEDPKALYVMGAAARLAQQPDWPDSLTTVSVEEGDIMLLRSAELGYPKAIQLIYCFHKHGQWDHSLPVVK